MDFFGIPFGLQVGGAEHETLAPLPPRRRVAGERDKEVAPALDRRTHAPPAGAAEIAVERDFPDRHPVVLFRPGLAVIVGILVNEKNPRPLTDRMLAEVVEDIDASVGGDVKSRPRGLTHLSGFDRVSDRAPGLPRLPAASHHQGAIVPTLLESTGGDHAKPGTVLTPDHVGLIVVSVAKDQPPVFEMAGIGGLREAKVQIPEQLLLFAAQQIVVVNEQFRERSRELLPTPAGIDGGQFPRDRRPFARPRTLG